MCPRGQSAHHKAALCASKPLDHRTSTGPPGPDPRAPAALSQGSRAGPVVTSPSYDYDSSHVIDFVVQRNPSAMQVRLCCRAAQLPCSHGGGDELIAGILGVDCGLTGDIG